MEFIENLSHAGRELFVERLIRKTFPKGASIITKGDCVAGAYFVLDGILRVYTLSPDGKQATLYRMTAGDTCVLALNSLFNDIAYPAWVEADENATIGVLPGEAYRSLFRNEAPIQDITMRALSSAVFGLMNELEARHSYTLDQRLAGYLLMRSSSSGHVNNTQQEIASEIGTTREVIGRLMAQFSSRGLVRSSRGKITVLDTQSLNAVIAIKTDAH